MTRNQSTQFELNGTLGVVEGPVSSVNRFLHNAGPDLVRGRSKFTTIEDKLVTNQRNVVKVTTYEPVVEPLGMPTMNFLRDTITHTGPSGCLPDPDAKSRDDRPANFAGAATPAPTDNSPLGLPDLWNDTPTPVSNAGPLGLPDLWEDEAGKKPSHAAGLAALGSGSVAEPSLQRNTRPGKSDEMEPLGLPQIEW